MICVWYLLLPISMITTLHLMLQATSSYDHIMPWKPSVLLVSSERKPPITHKGMHMYDDDELWLFSLLLPWICCWTNSGVDGYLRHHDIHVTLVQWLQLHYSDIIMSTMASQITGVSLVCSTVFQVQIKENIKALHHWPLWGESTGDQWIPLTKGQ